MQTSESISRLQPASCSSGAWLVSDESMEDSSPSEKYRLPPRLRDCLLLIPDYDGSAGELGRFVDSARHAADWIGDQDERTLLLALGSKLRGRASHSFGYKLHRYTGVDEFLASLCSCFSGAGCESELFAELHVARQFSGESVREYGARVDKLASQLCVIYREDRSSDAEARKANEKIVKDLALASFRRGLRSAELEVCVGSREPKSLEEAVGVAIVFDNQLRSRDRLYVGRARAESSCSGGREKKKRRC